MKILILEDNHERHKYFRKYLADHDLTIVETSDEMIALLKKNKTVDMLFLDHDLGGEVYVDSQEPNTGYQVVKWLFSTKFRPKIKVAIVHTCNSAGGQIITETLDQIGVDTYKIPFTQLNLEELLTFFVAASESND